MAADNPKRTQTKTDKEKTENMETKEQLQTEEVAKEKRENKEQDTNEKVSAEEELKTMLEKEKERTLRLSAELENYKKRSEKEIKEFKKFANESLLRRLLTVVDNLERAIAAFEDPADNKADNKSLLEGVKMTYKDLLDLFEAFNVKPIQAEGKPFDPTFHQAVTQEETDAVDDNTVVRELQKGYLFNERLIRPSMVVVSKNKE